MVKVTRHYHCSRLSWWNLKIKFTAWLLAGGWPASSILFWFPPARCWDKPEETPGEAAAAWTRLG